jgi:hypothetical protein
VDVLLGNGDGTFRPAVTYISGGNNSLSVAVADVNGDGKLDILVGNACTKSGPACLANGTVGVLLGNGDGTFQSGVAYGAAFGTRSVVVADVNGDVKPDLVVGSCCGTAVEVLLGNGDGTFQAAITYDTGGAGPQSVAIADVNGDAKPDLLVANSFSNTVGVLLNNTPFCTTTPVVTLSTTPTSLWPPNGKMVPVTVSGTITDSGTGCTVTARYAVIDEYGEVQPNGPVTLRTGGAYSFTVLLQASRLGADMDGRLYTIDVSASNNAGKIGSQKGAVIVRHDQGQ